MNFLKIDLTKQKIELKELSEKVRKKFIGGKGIGAYLLYKTLPINTSPFSPENPIIIAIGPLTGIAPSASRISVLTKSPLTGLFLDSYCGGLFGYELRKCDIDCLLVTGRAAKPVYLWISDGEYQIRSAEGIWSLSTYSAIDEIKKETDKNAKVLVIGPAGEKKVKFACLIADKYHSAGRGGAGAVFGSKNLKGIAVLGHKTPEIPKGEYKSALRKLTTSVYEKEKEWAKHGTTSLIPIANRDGMLPVKNFMENYDEQAQKLTGDEFAKYRVANKTCYMCPLACIKVCKIDSEEVSIQYEGLAMLGPNCYIFSSADILRAYLLCNKLGIDVISGGSVVAFVMECFERGVVSAKDIGYSVRFGDARAQIELLRGMVYEEAPIFKYMREGARALAKYLRAEKYAVHVKGLEMPAWDPRGLLGLAVSYATADIGGSHLRGWPLTDEKPRKSAVDVIPSLIKDREKKILIDSTILCASFAYLVDLEEIANLLILGTGNWSDLAEVVKCLRRIETLARIINLREGMPEDAFSLPHRLLNESSSKGPSRGFRSFATPEDFHRSLEEYYKQMGWSKYGIPLSSTLAELNLIDM